MNAYDEQTGKGWLRHLYVRTAQNGAALVCLVATGKNVPAEDALIGAVRTAWPDTAGIVLNVNARPGNSILGADYRVLWGAAELEDTLCGHVFALSVPSFYQVNRDQAEQLYALAVEFAESERRGNGAGAVLRCGHHHAGPGGSSRAGDWCGDRAGSNRKCQSKCCAQRYFQRGVFLRRRRRNGANMRRRGAAARCGGCGPARKGAGAGGNDAVAAMDPARVVYISCDPATLGRDVKRFAASGYRLHRAAAVDMFPRTHHVETVVLLSKERSTRKGSG